VAYDATSDCVYTCRAGPKASDARVVGLPDEDVPACCSYANGWDTAVFEVLPGGPAEVEASAGDDEDDERSPTRLVHTPVGLAVDGDWLYVCDAGLDRICVFGREEGPQRRFGASSVRFIGDAGAGEGEERGGGESASASLDQPRGIAADGEGRLYVSEERRVLVFECATGALLQVLELSDAVSLAGICLAGSHLIVADRGASVLHVLERGGAAMMRLEQRAREVLERGTLV
jgi:hypothetical protein